MFCCSRPGERKACNRSCAIRSQKGLGICGRNPCSPPASPSSRLRDGETRRHVLKVHRFSCEVGPRSSIRLSLRAGSRGKSPARSSQMGSAGCWRSIHPTMSLVRDTTFPETLLGKSPGPSDHSEMANDQAEKCHRGDREGS